MGVLLVTLVGGPAWSSFGGSNCCGCCGRVPICGWEDAVIDTEKEVCAACVDLRVDGFEKSKINCFVECYELAKVVLTRKH